MTNMVETTVVYEQLRTGRVRVHLMKNGNEIMNRLAENPAEAREMGDLILRVIEAYDKDAETSEETL